MSLRDRGSKMHQGARAEPKLERSMLSKIEVQRAIAAGAPPVPWKLRTEDREVIDKLATYFAKAIPVPTDEGRVVVKESFGYSGPQLELYVPVLSEKSPVAVMIRSWHSGDDLDADLYFFGAADGRLATILGRLGFKQRGDSDHAPGPVFRQSQVVTHKRAS